MPSESHESTFLLDRLNSILPSEASGSDEGPGAPYLAKEVVALRGRYDHGRVALNSGLDDVKVAEGRVELANTGNKIGEGGGDFCCLII